MGRVDEERFGTILIEVPNYPEIDEHLFEAIAAIPLGTWTLPKSHLYLWIDHQYLQTGLTLIQRWNFIYKTNLIWTKEALVHQAQPIDAPEDEAFVHVTECILFGVKGKLRTFAPGRRQTNSIRDHRTEGLETFPPELYTIIGQCSPAPFLEISPRPAPKVGWRSISYQEGMHEIGEFRSEAPV